MEDNVKIIQWINDNFKDKKILIVDEIDDTRRTLQYCINMLKIKNNANNIGIFVVHNKKKNKCIKFNDLFYISGEEIDDKWVVYPWDLSHLI